MNNAAKDLAAEYTAALREYLAGRGEAALRRAYEAGRQALAGRLGVLEMAAAHQRAVIEALRSCSCEQEKERVLLRSLSCFAESLSPYEMVLRGVQESNARLAQSLAELERVEERLREQNRMLAAAHYEVEKEHQRYQALFEFAPDGYLVTGLDGAIEEVNTAAAVLLNVEKDSLRGQSLLDWIAEDDREAFRVQLRGLETGALEKIEDWQISIQPGEGPPFPAALTVAAFPGAGRGPALLEVKTGVLRWLIRDATGRRRLEIERARSLVDHVEAQAARRFEFLAEASSLLVGSFDMEAALASVARLALPYLAEWCFINIVEADGSFRQLEVAHATAPPWDVAKDLKNYCLFRKPGRSDSEILVAASRIVEEVDEAWCEEAAECGAHARLLARFTGRSAMVIPLLSPLLSRERLMGVLTFISSPQQRRYTPSDLALGEDLARRCALALENARLYHEVIAERDKAEKASRAKDEFLAILSHELRNPLMPLIGWTRMMKSNPAISQDPVLAEGVRSMERNAQTLSRLVADCLDLARISEGKIQMEKQAVDLNQIVAASIEATRELAAAKELKVTAELLAGPVLLLGDATRLEQVVMNLLVNAIKYTDHSGCVTVRSAKCDGEIEIEVRDSGIGIHPAFLEQIFQPFRRGSNSWLTHQSGLGLGLAIARQIVEMHGGRIWAESGGLDYGSTFRVRLPMAALAAPEDTRDPLGLHRLGSARTPDGGGIQILLIEDSEDILFLLKIELETQGHSVTTANHGSIGLEIAKMQCPDLIISDIKMPGMDGYELIRAIRATSGLCEIPAIALTGFGAKADFDRAIAAGFDACVSKPAEPEEISALIAMLTGKRKAIQA